MPPMKNGRVGATRKKIMLKSTTKNGYAISIIEAEDAPMLLIAVKIKKLATAAKITDSTISASILLDEKTDLMESCS